METYMDEVKCQYCETITTKSKAIYLELNNEKSTHGWICKDHIDKIHNIAHLTYEKNGKINHMYYVSKKELTSLIEDNDVTNICILKSNIDLIVRKRKVWNTNKAFNLRP